MSTEFSKRRFIIGAVVMISVLALFIIFGRYFGINITKSVPFRFYYHTEIKTITNGDYILFKFPENDLYTYGIPAVKQVVCSPGQILETREYDDRIEYYCDGVTLLPLVVFKRPNGDLLTTFIYNGTVPEGKYFITGSDIMSYDSKYWGFLDSSRIMRKVHPIRFFKQAHAAETSFYGDKDKGWYKYQKEPVKEEPKKKDDSKKEKREFVMPDIPWVELPNMHPEEFSALFKEVENYAMSYRNLQNFDTYAKMRTVLINRANEFMNVGTLWAQLNPEDTNEAWFPTSGFGQDIYKAESAKIQADYIRKNKERFGIIYLYRTDCPYCLKQAPILDYFESETSWKLKRVNIEQIPEAALRFNVQSVPALILVERETERSMLLASGLMTYEEIAERLYRTIKFLRGESDEKDFINPVRPDNNIVGSNSVIR